MSALDRDPQLTEVEAARELRVSRDTIRREREAGRLPYLAIRGKIFYLLSDLMAYRDSCRVTASPEGRAAPNGTSSGRKADVAAAVRRARQTVKRLKSSSQRSDYLSKSTQTLALVKSD